MNDMVYTITRSLFYSLHHGNPLLLQDVIETTSCTKKLTPSESCCYHDGCEQAVIRRCATVCKTFPGNACISTTSTTLNNQTTSTQCELAALTTNLPKLTWGVIFCDSESDLLFLEDNYNKTGSINLIQKIKDLAEALRIGYNCSCCDINDSLMAFGI